MKYLVCFIVFIVSWKAAADPIYDTIYHPFYAGKQLIELRIHTNFPPEKGFIQVDQSLSANSNLSKYVLRDSTGNILFKYNDYTNLLNPKNLKSCKASQLHLKAHHLKTKNTSSYIGNDDSGCNIVYPVYTCLPSDNGACQKMKFGLLDSLGNLVLPIEYDQIQWIDSVFITKNNDSYSLYSEQFELLLSDYQMIEYINTNKDHILLKKNDKYGLINRSGKYLLAMQFDQLRISKYMYGRYEFLKNGLWGFVDYNFTSFLPPFSPTPNLFQRDNYFEFYDEEKLWNVIDSSGRTLLRSTMQMYQVINNNRFLVYNYTRENGYERYLVDALDKKVIDNSYYDIWRINKNTLIAGYDAKIHDASNLKKSYKWTILDENGRRKTKEEYKSLQPIDEEFLSAWTFSNKLYVLDENGNDVLGYAVEDVYKYAENIYKIRIDGKHQFLDLHHPQFVSKKYDQLQCIRNNLFGVQKDGLWGFVNGTTLKEIFPIRADQILCFQDGIASVKINNEWILIDSLGQLYSKDHFNQTMLLDDGYAKVESNGKFGIMNDRGTYVIPMMYDEMKFIVSHENAYFIGVKLNGKYGIINLKNEILYPFIFESCAELTVFASNPQKRTDGFYAFLTITKRSTLEYYYLNFDPAKTEVKIQANPSKGFKIVTKDCFLNQPRKCVGVVNWDGQTIIPCTFSSINDLKYNTFEVHTTKGAGLMDTMGRILIPPIYAYMYELGHDSTLLQVGRHSGTWGLFDRSGKQLADTIYGGFESPIGKLIPFHANYNYRIVENKWVYDEKKIGLMDFTGRIVIEPIYDSYSADYKTKGCILLRYKDGFCTVNQKGELIDGKWNEKKETTNTINDFELPINTEKVKIKKKKRRKKARWL